MIYCITITVDCKALVMSLLLSACSFCSSQWKFLCLTGRHLRLLGSKSVGENASPLPSQFSLPFTFSYYNIHIQVAWPTSLWSPMNQYSNEDSILNLSFIPFRGFPQSWKCQILTRYAIFVSLLKIP